VKPFTLLILLAGAGLVTGPVALWLVVSRGRESPLRALDLVLLALCWLSIAGVLGIGWLLVETLRYDGWMQPELEIGGGLMALLAALIAGAAALRRRGRPVSAVVTAALAGAPTAAVFGLLLYLNSHPIDMR
jgi:hypothetical protein